MAVDDINTLARLGTMGWERMASARKARMACMREYVGRFYSTWNEQPVSNPINLIWQATTTLVPNLVFRRPQARIRALIDDYREYADVAALATTKLAEELKLKDTLRKVVTDSIFMAGFVKLGLCNSDRTIQVDEWTVDPGMPFCSRVSPSDMILDPLGEDWYDQRLIGNRFRMRRDEALESGMYDEDALRAVPTRTYHGHDASQLLGGGADEAMHLQDVIEAVEIWLPGSQEVVTLPWSPEGEIVPTELARVQWEGPEEGPYRMLGYAFVPDNVLPLPPVAVWYDLHQAAARAARRIGEQAERGKSILAYTASGWQDAENIQQSGDGSAVQVEDIDSIKEVQYGGATDTAHNYLDWAKNEFSSMAMNIDLLSGTRSQEPTATQAEILQTNTTIRLNDMQNLVYDWVGECLQGLFFYLHTDPLIEMPLIQRRQGQHRTVVYTPEMREGRWIDFNITVRPYSMSRQDPNTRTRRLMEFFASVIPAVAQAYQILGPALNIENAINIIGQEMGIEELDDIINSPLLQQQMERLQTLLEQGVPLDRKVVDTVMRGQQGLAGAGAGPAQPGMAGAMGGARPQQPNPGAMMQANITPGVERNQMRHETEAELQAMMG